MAYFQFSGEAAKRLKFSHFDNNGDLPRGPGKDFPKYKKNPDNYLKFSQTEKEGLVFSV